MHRKKLLAIGLALTMTFAATVTGVAAPLTAVEAQQLVSSSTAKLSKSDIALLKKMFDADFFAAKYPQIAAVVGNDATALFNYFVSYGIWEGKQPNAEFDVQAYAAANPDLTATFTTNVLVYYRHFDEKGKDESRIATKEGCIAVGITESTIKSFVLGVDEDGTPRFAKGTPLSEADKSISIKVLSENGNAVAAQVDRPIGSLGTITSTNIASQLNNASATQTSAPAASVEETSPVPVPEVMEMHHPSWTPTDAQVQALIKAHSNWLSVKPDPYYYMSSEERSAYDSAIVVWEGNEPDINDFMSRVYSTPMYATLSDAQYAYEQAHDAWEAGKPTPTEFMTEAEETSYVADVTSWLESKPDLESAVYAIYDDTTFTTDHSAWEAGKPTQDDYKIYTSVDEGVYATGELAKAAYDSAHALWVEGQAWEATDVSDYTSLLDPVLIGTATDGSIMWTAVGDDSLEQAGCTDIHTVYPTSDINDTITWDGETNILSAEDAAKLDTCPTSEADALAAEKALAKPAGYTEGDTEPAASDYYTVSDDTATYEEALENYVAANPEPVLNDFTYYMGQDEDAFDSDTITWEGNDPYNSVGSYMTGDEYAAYQQALTDYATTNPEPDMDDYHYVNDGHYPSEDAAKSAYSNAYNGWYSDKPDGEEYITDDDELAAYESEVSNWESYEPILSESVIDNHGFDSDDSSDWEYLAPGSI